MNTKTVAVSVISTTVGIVAGSYLRKIAVKQKLKDMSPTLARLIVDCAEKIHHGDMTMTELHSYMQDRLEFLKNI